MKYDFSHGPGIEPYRIVTYQVVNPFSRNSAKGVPAGFIQVKEPLKKPKKRMR